MIPLPLAIAALVIIPIALVLGTECWARAVLFEESMRWPWQKENQ